MSYNKYNLRVAVCTEAIIYCPFYLAYLSNDFKENPFEPGIEVSIIDKDNDIFRESNQKLRGDDFVLFCLLFDIADVGICDPTVFIHFFKKPEDYVVPLKKFKKNLKDQNGKISKQIDKILADNQVCETELEALKINRTKIVGSIVSDLAVNILKRGGAEHSSMKFFPSHPEPSTLYYLFHSRYNNKAEKSDFGFEIDNWHNLNNDQLIGTCDLVASCIFESDEFKRYADHKSVSCDIEVIDVAEAKAFLLNGSPRVDAAKVIFTGILSNTVDKRKHILIKAFLYAINKKLYKINSLLENDVVGLKKYFRHKLLADNKNDKLVADLLISSSTFYDDYFTANGIPNEERFNYIIEYFVKKLVKLKKDDVHLFANNVDFSINALLPVLSIRIKKDNFIEANKDSTEELEQYKDSSFLNAWKKKVAIREFIKNSLMAKILGYPKLLRWNRKDAFVKYLTVFLIAFSFYYDFHEYQFGSTRFIEWARSLFWTVKIYPSDAMLYHTIPEVIWWSSVAIGVYIIIGLYMSNWLNKNERYFYDE